jgi:SAM-dependent methyltransferase
MKDQASNPLPRLCDYEGSDYRSSFWEGSGREYENLAERTALRKLLPDSGERLIDIGGGYGRLFDLYSGYREVVLLDQATSQLQDARARLGDTRAIYVAANLYQMPFSAQAFDCAVMVRVLHHLPDVSRAFQAIQALLVSGGCFILEYANKRHLKAILRHLLRRGEHNPFDPKPCEFVELNYNFHPQYVEHRLQSAGFRIRRQLSVSLLRVNLLKRWIPPRILAAVDGWLQHPAASLKCSPSMFLKSLTVTKTAPNPPAQLFCCPHCRSDDLSREPGALRCEACGRRWSTAGGIYDFRQPLG